MDSLRQDIRHAGRSLWHSPGFTIVAVACLGVGIGGATAMFGIVDALFLRPPVGVRDAAAVVRLTIARTAGMITAPEGAGGSYPNYLDLAKAPPGRGLAAVAAFRDDEYSVGRGASATKVPATAVTASYFDVLGAQPLLGRFFAADETGPTAPHQVAVLSYRMWERDFGGSPHALGQTAVIDNQPYTVIGVAPPGFNGASLDRVDFWLPITQLHTSDNTAVLETRLTNEFSLIGRLAPGVSRRVATAAASALVAAGDRAEPNTDPNPRVQAEPLLEARGPHRSDAATIALWLLGAVACVLLVACINIANLLLARGARKRREVSIRISLGAGRTRLVRQALVEASLVAAAGAALGIVIAMFSIRVASYFDIAGDRPLVTLDVLAFATIVSFAAALASALAPALALTRGDLTVPLKDGAPTGGAARMPSRSWLLGAQAALSLVVLATAGLFLQSLHNVLSIDLAFDADDVILASADLRAAHFDSADAAAIYDRMVAGVTRIPGVSAVSIADIPMYGGAMAYPLRLANGQAPPALPRGPYINFVGPGYFAATGTRILRGRDIAVTDRAGAPAVVVVSAGLANAYWPAREAVGQCLHIGGTSAAAPAPCAAVVGVVADAKTTSITGPMIPYYYLPRAQQSVWWLPTVVVRTRTDRQATISAIRTAIAESAPGLPYIDVRPVKTELAGQLRPYRLGAALFTTFATVALTLAALGLYGVVAYVVAQRTRELGVRMALGARGAQVVTLAMRQGMGPMILGTMAGVLGALATTRLLDSHLYGVRSTDAGTLVAAAVVLCATAGLACYVPARRAARVDPVVALRAE